MNESELQVVSASIGDWSLVPPDTSITFRFSQGVDPRSAQSGIRFVSQSLRAEVFVSDDCMEATWMPLAPLPEGEHKLRVEGVTTTDGQSDVTPFELHFSVTEQDHSGNLYGQVLLHQSRTRLRMSDRQYRVSKLLDPESGKRYEVAVDENGEQVDLEALIREDQRATYDKFGKVHPVLYAEIERRGETDRLPVGIWIAVPEERADKGQAEFDPCGDAPEPLLSYREEIRKSLEPVMRFIRDRFEGVDPSPLETAPLILADLTPGQIRELVEFPEVQGVFLHEQDGILDIQNSMNISGAEKLVNAEGWRGTGTRVGVWENGADDTSRLVIEAAYSSTPTTGQHTRLVTGIIRNTELSFATRVNGQRRYKCYAPQSRIFAANTMDTRALEWAITDRQCRVINQSFHRRSEAASSDQSLDDILKDYLTVHFPFPTIVQAAGNYWMGDDDNISPPSDEYVNHKGFNSISVGNHDDTAGAMDGSSVFRNPATTHGDRELPEISANGTAVTAVGVTTQNTGTSFASPAVAGSVALLQQIDTTLSIWPEGSRAILFASAVNVVGRTWMRDLRAGVDASDGAGALDVHEAAHIAQNRARRDNRGEQRGWDVDTFDPGDFDDVGDWRHVYRIRIPLLGTSTRVKVALAWDVMGSMRIEVPFATIWIGRTPNDYDLYVYDDQGAMVAWSASWDNSYEIAEFTGRPGKTYTVRITKASGDEASYYGIAWNIRDLPLLAGISESSLAAYIAALGG